MTKADLILKLSAKLQKQMHLINSEKQRKNPKMLCDNLASRILNEILNLGMLPPLHPDHESLNDLTKQYSFEAEND